MGDSQRAWLAWEQLPNLRPLWRGRERRGERASPSSRALATLFPTCVARGPLELEDLREGSTCACAHAAFPPSFPFRSPLFTGLGEGGGKREERELGLSQWAGGPRARPPPSLRRRPIEIYYNVVASREGGARGAGWLRAGPALASRREGGRARAGAASSLPLLVRSFPPSGRRVSQSVSQSACSP